MITPKHKEIAQHALEYALKNGCSASRVSVTIANNNSIEYRNTQPDKLHQSSENKLYIELFVDGRYGTFSTNRLNRSELESLINENIISTRLLAEDPYRQLPDNVRFYKYKTGDNLDLSDKTFFEHSTEQKIELAKNTVNEIYGSDNRIISVVAAYDDGFGSEYMITSNGFEGETTDSAYSLTAEVSLKTDSDARPESYWYDNKVYWKDLEKSGIALKALNRTLLKLGQKKIKSGSYNMLLDNTVSSRVLSPLISAMYGSALQQKNSFLLNKLHSPIASSILTISDNPHNKKTFGSRWYDGEGVATKEQNIIEKGILNTYFIDTYNALKLHTEPTIASPSVITFEKGSNSFEHLIKKMHNGIWVTGFNGGNTNGTTGDFSFGVEGFLVEKGIATQPITEMNITGNMLDLWYNLIEVGNDPFSNCSSRQVPSLLFENVSFSGL